MMKKILISIIAVMFLAGFVGPTFAADEPVAVDSQVVVADTVKAEGLFGISKKELNEALEKQAEQFNQQLVDERERTDYLLEKERDHSNDNLALTVWSIFLLLVIF